MLSHLSWVKAASGAPEPFLNLPIRSTGVVYLTIANPYRNTYVCAAGSSDV